MGSAARTLAGMFNLNDPRWGRGEDNNTQGEGEQRPDSDRPVPPPSSQQPSQGRNNQAGQPPDLDELWRDLNRKLGLAGWRQQATTRWFTGWQSAS